jgi:C4-dicarboxylate-specific signal transduction histidine kinase
VTKTGVVTVPAEGPVRNLVEPIVHIENVRVDGEPTDLDTAVELRSGARRVEFEYTATSFTAPEKVQFRYQLGGYNDQWIEAGTQRRASYTDLPPGQYVFRVTADNGHGVWSGENETLDLTVLPRWWELTWLRITAALAALALLVGYFKHRLRVARQTNAALRREMSERQRAEEESRIQQLQLVRVSRAASMGELTTSIAHEVKQPLFAIISNAQAARRFLDRKEPDVEEVSEALEEIAEDGERASEIVEHVRSLMQRERRPSQRLDLSEVARDATRFAEPEIRRRGLVIDTQLAADLPPVEGNPIELQQVILNLLINGAQAMKTMGHSEPRHLAVRTRADNGSVELAVEDHGAGVSDEVIDKMFEPFFTTKPTGTGMGLAINRTIIEAHGGRIWATRNEGAGSTFCFCLPACRESQS